MSVFPLYFTKWRMEHSALCRRRGRTSRKTKSKAGYSFLYPSSSIHPIPIVADGLLATRNTASIRANASRSVLTIVSAPAEWGVPAWCFYLSTRKPKGKSDHRPDRNGDSEVCQNRHGSGS